MTVKESLKQIVECLPEEDQSKLLDFAQYLRWRQDQEEEAKSDEDDAQTIAPLLANLDPEDWEDVSVYERAP